MEDTSLVRQNSSGDQKASSRPITREDISREIEVILNQTEVVARDGYIENLFRSPLERRRTVIRSQLYNLGSRRSKVEDTSLVRQNSSGDQKASSRPITREDISREIEVILNQTEVVARDGYIESLFRSPLERDRTGVKQAALKFSQSQIEGLTQVAAARVDTIVRQARETGHSYSTSMAQEIMNQMVSLCENYVVEMWEDFEKIAPRYSRMTSLSEAERKGLINEAIASTREFAVKQRKFAKTAADYLEAIAIGQDPRQKS